MSRAQFSEPLKLPDRLAERSTKVMSLLGTTTPWVRRGLSARPFRMVLLSTLGFLTLTSPLQAAPIEKPKCPQFKTLCIQAKQDVVMDQNLGIAEFRGGVLGKYTPQDMWFQADTVRAFRMGKQEWSRLEMVGEVHMEQPGALAQADHARMDPDRVVLTGNAILNQPPQIVEGYEIVLNQNPNKVVVRASVDPQKDQKPAHLLYVEPPKDQVSLKENSTEGQPEEAGQTQVQPEAPQSPQVSERIEATAQELVFDEITREVVLTGNVHLTQASEQMEIRTQALRIRFDEEQQFQDFRAEGGVRISQPGRELQSDIAVSQKEKNTILLIGNARIQSSDGSKLQSDQIEVYTDAEKGVVKSEESKKPLSLSFQLQREQKRDYSLTRMALTKLSGKGVPNSILDRLAPLVDQRFTEEHLFEKEVMALLEPEEQKLFLTLILEAAQ